MDINEALNKKLSMMLKILSTPSRKKHNVKPHDGTMSKLVLVLLTAMILRSDEQGAISQLDAFSEVIFYILNLIRDSEDPLSMLERAIEYFDPDSHYKALSMSNSCVSDHIPYLTKEVLDQLLGEDYQEEVKILNSLVSTSNESLIAIDTTHDKTTTKYPNNETPYVVVGQKVRNFERGFNFLAFQDATRQLVMGLKNIRNPVAIGDRTDYKPWIKELFRKIEVANSSGINVKIIEADRGFCTNEIYALSYLGVLRNENTKDDFIRVVTPRKYSNNKSEVKWRTLLDPNSREVSIRDIWLSEEATPELKEICQKYSLPERRGKYKFPIVNVALFNEYKKFPNKDLKWAKKRAVHIDKAIEETKQALSEAENEYRKIETALHKRTFIPSYKRGKLRKKFASDDEKKIYDRLFTIYSRLKKYKKEKEMLIRGLTQFNISLAYNEDIKGRREEFIGYAQAYHLRWNIENGFRDQKRSFMVLNRTRKSTRRQFYWLLASILYNCWQTQRTMETLSKMRKLKRSIHLYEPGKKYLRRKKDAKVEPKLTARGYLQELWKIQIKNVISASLEA